MIITEDQLKLIQEFYFLYLRLKRDKKFVLDEFEQQLVDLLKDYRIDYSCDLRCITYVKKN